MGIHLSARAIVIHDSKILLNEMGDGAYYNFPGGRIEDYEIASETVVREVLEETGHHAEVENYIFTSDYEPNRHNHSEGDCHRINIFFRCTLKEGAEKEIPAHPDGDPCDSTLKSKPIWVPFSDLQSIPFVPSAIKNTLIKYLETGIFEPKYFVC